MTREARPKLQGALIPPGDKSIAHRAALIASLADGVSEIESFAPGDDCARTLSVLEALGTPVERSRDRVRIEGRGLQGFAAPSQVLDAGNSGSTLRMSTGILVAQSFDSVITGDESLRRRPMRRVIEPLAKMGAVIEGTPEGTAPLTIHGAHVLQGTSHDLALASAQVKTALLFAGLHASGRTRVRERLRSRDHTERLLPLFGAPITFERDWIVVGSASMLSPVHFRVPGDLSSAAFFIVAATLLDGSDLLVRRVGLNRTRTGFLDVLEMMGARFELDETSERGVEPEGDVRVRSSELHGVAVPQEWAPRLIDEVPILAVAAAFASGDTVIAGVEELRHKESNRLAALVEGLRALGARAESAPDALIVKGSAGGSNLHGASLSSRGDHRMAMAWTVAALALGEPCLIDGKESVGVSYPGFFSDLERLAA